MLKGKRYLFLIVNTDRSEKLGMHWWSIMSTPNMKHVLRIIYNDHQCTLEELLERDNSFMIHEKNLQKLHTEMFKVNNGLSVQLVKVFI